MKTKWIGLLVLGLAGCGKPLEIAPEVALKHQYDAAFQQQAQLLQAEQVKVSAAPAAPGGPALPVLTLEVVISRNAPEQHPDTLKQRVRKLAHLLVADLASPDRYQAVNAQAVFSHGLFSLGNQPVSQAFIYSTASLR